MERRYDVIIVGGGITGASLLYVLSRYTNVKSILLLEKYGDLACLNSNSMNNAQTLHFGDIETNYSLEQSKHTKESAGRILRYTEMLPRAARNNIIKECQKMVLGVGEEEVKRIEGIYSSGLKKLFPGLKMIGKKELERLEPNVVKGRNPGELISALLSDNGHMMDFGALTHSFAKNARLNKRIKIDLMFNTKVSKIKKDANGYEVVTAAKSYHSDFVVFATGSYSLYFAKMLGYDKNLSILAIGGNFYTSPRVLQGKVYRVQIGGVPFAAIHGDPDITDPNVTRFGPTVTIPIQLERHHNETSLDYLKTFDFDIPTLISLKRILFNKDISRILLNNAVYDMPFIGRYEFLKREASNIVPSLKYGNLRFAKNNGGIRPQVIDENKRAFLVGGVKIKEENLIFTVTPSPGASSCLQGSLEDAMYITQHLDKKFDADKFAWELGPISKEAKFH